MINDGVLENPKVDAIFGYHNWPGMAVGKMGTRSGAILAGFSRFEIIVNGKAAHVAMPQNAINPVTIRASIVVNLIKRLLIRLIQQFLISPILKGASLELG